MEFNKIDQKEYLKKEIEARKENETKKRQEQVFAASPKGVAPRRHNKENLRKRNLRKV